jgi:hypothetical protein
MRWSVRALDARNQILKKDGSNMIPKHTSILRLVVSM